MIKRLLRTLDILKKSSVMGDAASAILISKSAKENKIIESQINVDATIF